MTRGLWKTTDGLDQLFLAKSASLRQRLALHHFRKQRGTRHGGHASLRAETDFGDAAIGDPQRELQHISAGRIFNLDGCGWIRDFPGIARILKMLENLRRVHLTEL